MSERIVVSVDWNAYTLRPTSVVAVVDELSKVSPVRLRCSCGSRVWINAPDKWLTQNFVLDHADHGQMVAEQILGTDTGGAAGAAVRDKVAG